MNYFKIEIQTKVREALKEITGGNKVTQDQIEKIIRIFHAKS